MFSPWCLLSVLHFASTNLFLELGQLPRQVGHQFHGALQFLLQVSDFILLPVCIAADQGHGPHPREPVQVVLLVNRNHETVGSHSFVGACCCGFSGYPKWLLLVLHLFLQINCSNFYHSLQLQIIHTFSPQMESGVYECQALFDLFWLYGPVSCVIWSLIYKPNQIKHEGLSILESHGIWGRSLITGSSLIGDTVPSWIVPPQNRQTLSWTGSNFLVLIHILLHIKDRHTPLQSSCELNSTLAQNELVRVWNLVLLH